MKNKLPDPAWFTFSELADRWCVSIETVTRYIKCGMLKHSDPPGTSGPMAGYRVMLAGHDGHNLHLYNPRDVIYLEEVLRFEAEHKIGQRQVKAKQR
ncbi:MAG: hypothetical protein OEL57_08590, partial [Trichlorobacter sp.]|uniref:hypothetical protein n=1 Tax=Trichlorobacter sp. TaxID=2911007 RepID=UPI0025650B78